MSISWKADRVIEGFFYTLLGCAFAFSVALIACLWLVGHTIEAKKHYPSCWENVDGDIVVRR